MKAAQQAQIQAQIHLQEAVGTLESIREAAKSATEDLSNSQLRTQQLATPTRL